MKKAFSCAEAFPLNRSTARIAAEDALILYDEKTHVEQFIRQAVFDSSTDADDFGFLVPTPTPPTLSTTDAGLLPQMSDYSQPKIVQQIRWKIFGWLPNTKARQGGSGLSNRRWILATEQRVGDMDAAIVQASDASTLRQWLTKHGYTTRPALDKWLATYIKRGWTITAFKIVRDGGTLSTSSHFTNKATILMPVRMTFRTPYAFYPYQEPSDAPFNRSRRLQIYFVGAQRMHGTLHTDMPGNLPKSGAPWTNIAELSRPLTDSQKTQIARLAMLEPGETVGKRLTVFQDTLPLRPPGKDLYFLPSPDQSIQERKMRLTKDRDVAEFIPWLVAGLTIVGVTRLIRRKTVTIGKE